MGSVTLRRAKELDVPRLDDPRVREELWREAEREVRAAQLQRLAARRNPKG